MVIESAYTNISRILHKEARLLSDVQHLMYERFKCMLCSFANLTSTGSNVFKQGKIYL